MNFQQISSHCGGKREAFEELCCQLARRTLQETVLFTRLDGSGGDGGVECFADFPDGTRTGWQAKYVFKVDSLLTQIEKSLNTALEIHPSLTRYVVCFPFDLTGKTNRKGLSGVEKADIWREKKISDTRDRQLTIELWPESKLLELLLRHDVSGGMREFFFNERVLTDEWFSKHLESARTTAGARYTPELNVQTDLWKCFAAFGRTSAWSREFKEKILKCRETHGSFVRALRESKPDPALPAWPEDLRADSQALATDIEKLYEEYDRTVDTENPESYKSCISQFDDILSRLRFLESQLVSHLEEKHGEGAGNSPGFRQYMSEYMVSFPAANLDDTRNLTTALEDLNNWFRSPACLLAYEKVFLLKGVAGSGKTHGVCDAAGLRLGENLLTCVVFGHKFGDGSDLWTRLLETLGLPMTLGRDCFLDALNAAGEASGSPLLLCIDAVNETRPLRYWHDQLAAFVQEVEGRSHLRLCITCRTSFIPFCLPDDHGLPVVEHSGFAGVEHIACQTFFKHYDLDPPIAPILQPEFSNPLYLRLVCETLHSRGLRSLPMGWQGLAPIVRAFLEEKEKQFALDKETSIGSKTVSACLMAVSKAIADSGKSALQWSEAEDIISTVRPQVLNLQILEWLVQNDLLLEDAPDSSGFAEECSLRPAFERLGDFFVAEKLMEKCEDKDIYDECEPSGLLHDLLKDPEAIEQNNAILATLSIIIPERNSGLEIHDLANDELIRELLIQIAIESFPFRSSESLTSASGFLIREALASKELSFAAMDAVLASSWQSSSIDAMWLDELLKEMSLARRDSYWCAYLHDRFEKHGTVYRMIEAAFELPLNKLELGVAERWTLMLLWFTAAADRRVKDEATRAATAILVAKPEAMNSVLKRLLESDDDEVRERALLVCYGALIISRDIDQCNKIALILHSAFANDPEVFDNALVRDHIRCIAELAKKLDPDSNTLDPEFAMCKVGSFHGQKVPPDDKIEKWGELLRFEPSEFKSDFFKYSMGCLRPWENAVSREDMAKWMLEQIASVLGYEDSDCKAYDQFMISKYGGGRNKPAWAERIGKKYQWISMYQLASRLHDQFEREEDSWDSEPLRTPLILLEERKLDPTLPREIAASRDSVESWWIRSAADLEPNKALSDEEWVTSSEGIPELKDLLSEINHHGTKWRLLLSYPSWNSRDEDAGSDIPYREVWIHIQSYLVQEQEFVTAYGKLQKRNFFGRWMPEGDRYLYGFAGEYPWATSFNVYSEENQDYGQLYSTFRPSWNELVVEWEYDSSVPGNFTIIVPARAFFSSGDLWWNGKDGYSIIDGTTVFRDPSVMDSGPISLLADSDELQERLRKLGFRLVWTLLGEKMIVNESADNFQRRTFSQSAYLTEKGSLKIGERVFFDDYEQDTELGSS